MKVYHLISFLLVIAVCAAVLSIVINHAEPSGPSVSIGKRANIQEIATRNRNQNINCINAASRLLYELRGENFNAAILVGEVPSMESHVWVIVTDNPNMCGVAIEPNSGTVIPLNSFVGMPCYNGVIYESTESIDASTCRGGQ